MSTVSIATDGSEQAATASRLGLEIAKATRDEVIFIAVWAMIRSAFGVPYTYLKDTSLEAEKEGAEQVLAACKEHAATLGINAETLLVEGSAAYEICHAAKQCNARTDRDRIPRLGRSPFIHVRKRCIGGLEISALPRPQRRSRNSRPTRPAPPHRPGQTRSADQQIR